jgi:signal transduction histidine kinase
MPRLFFEPSARLQKFLGRELIADPNLAIAEFVKNAYDAGATEVYIDFELKGLSKEQQSLTISDNGSGMNLEAFRSNWMRPGFSEKAKPTALEQSRRLLGRVPVGEKGLGRLAAGRLGYKLEVFTRRSARKPWLHVVFDWHQFDDMDKALRSIPIIYDEQTEPQQTRFPVGTIIRITSLTLDWSGFVPGRKVLGRDDTRLGRLRQDLQILVLPLSRASKQFQINLACDDPELSRHVGVIAGGAPELIDYKYDFSIKTTRDGIEITRTLTRSPDVARLVSRRTVTESTETIPRNLSPSMDPHHRPGTLRSGPFRGTFYYAPRTGLKTRQLGLLPGVFLYRDGVRVDPYGHEDNDWLGARARKAARAGYAAIQPKNLAGQVLISKTSDPDLVDMSNRQGLVENEAYDDFIAYVSGEFRNFEKLIFDEYVEPGWGEAAQQEARRGQAYGGAVIRAIVHSIRQPVTGLGAEMNALDHITKTSAMPESLRERLSALHARSTGHLTTIDQAIERLLQFDPREETERFRLAQAIDQAIQAVGPLAKTFGVDIRVEDQVKGEVTLPRTMFVDALAEVLRNGIQAPRPDGRSPRWVSIKVHRRDTRHEILIADNGSGMPTKIADRLFNATVSTKGRPGLGAMLAHESMAVMRGDLALEQNSDEGTTFRITLPASRTGRGNG